MSRVRWRMLVPMALLLLPNVAAAASRLAELGGHLSIGYAKLVTTKAPGGSISLGAGLDVPVARTFRAGVDVGYDLLGSRTEQRGSLYGSVDYSAFRAAALVHWVPEGVPVRLSIGPALVGAHGDLTVASGGASFSDLAVHETGAAMALQASLLPQTPAPVRLGLELGACLASLSKDDWTLLTLRATVFY